MNMIISLCASLLLALFLATKLIGSKSLNRIKAHTVGHGQHGSARWATRKEIQSYYTMVSYDPQKWRMVGVAVRCKNQPKNDEVTELQKKYEFHNERNKKNMNNILQSLQPGFVLGFFQHGRHGKKITAWVDAGDSHAMMIASPGGGKTAYFLYPNIEYVMACGISFVTLDTKGDLYRNMATIGEKYYGYHTLAPEISIEQMKEELSSRQIVIIGGHPNWQSKLKNAIPDLICLGPDASGTTDPKIVDKADKVFFFTDTIGHSKYNQFINVVRERKVSFGYLHSVNLEKGIHEMYRQMIKE